MKKAILFLAVCTCLIFKLNAQNSVSMTNYITSQGPGLDVSVDYSYTNSESFEMEFHCAIERRDPAVGWQPVSDVARTTLNVPAGTSDSGTLVLSIPELTTLSADLPGDEFYRITVELRKPGLWTEDPTGWWDWYAGAYDNFEIAVPLVSMTNYVVKQEVGGDVSVDYSYMNNEVFDMEFHCAIERRDPAVGWQPVSDVARTTLNAPAGTSDSGTLVLSIPVLTTLSADLPGDEFYRITVELRKPGLWTEDPTGWWDWYGGSYDNFEIVAPSLGVDDQVIYNRISIYPNPVQSRLNISNLKENQVKSYQITNILGKSVYKSIENDLNSVDVSMLKRGMYILSLGTDYGYKHIKFVKE
ncbi:T9SS type A sorting domain-containing protein [Aestuariivivens sediminis]|uniref:T9SS type A sorting domain-containing protein n=1 Tax=Aestuariivivens sediminis TaxID=2913557 RepID=UPI001F58BF7A|nr:T9SS type A sorting domain-containing protein [Aestuariivivens sediminis]